VCSLSRHSVRESGLSTALPASYQGRKKKSDHDLSPPRHLRHTSPLSALFRPGRLLPTGGGSPRHSPYMHTRPGHTHGNTPSSVSIPPTASRVAFQVAMHSPLLMYRCPFPSASPSTRSCRLPSFPGTAAPTWSSKRTAIRKRSRPLLVYFRTSFHSAFCCSRHTGHDLDRCLRVCEAPGRQDHQQASLSQLPMCLMCLPVRA